MTVYYAKDGGGSATTGSANIDRLEVDDKVYIKSDDQVATGDRGTFDMNTEILMLSGKEVVLSRRRQRAGRLQAHRRYEVRAGPGRSLRRRRVMMSITPPKSRAASH